MTQPTITITVKTTDENNGSGYYCIQETFPGGAVANSGHWDTAEEAFNAMSQRELALLGTTVNVMHKRYERIILTTTTTYVTTITR